jgi:uncharacterized coiled-coil protein SlyX
MWQIMWLLSLLPNFVYHLLLIFAILAFGASYILKMVPFITTNALVIRIASALLIVFCVWVEGGIANEAKWEARVAELEIKVAKAEKAAAEANGKIETVYVDRVKVVKEIQYVVKNRIIKNAAKLDLTCKVDPLAIDILNQSASVGVKK